MKRLGGLAPVKRMFVRNLQKYRKFNVKGLYIIYYFVRNVKRFFADKIIKTPYMADSITQGTLASWEKSKLMGFCSALIIVL